MTRETTKTDVIVETLVRQIATGVLPAQARLPSLRAAASSFGASKNTVVEAYERLVARQLIQSRPGAGFFVSSLGPSAGKESTHAPLSAASDRVSLLRAQLSQDFSVRVGDGRPPVSWMREALPRRFPTDVLFEKDGDPTGYGDTYGYRPLRQLISAQHQARGLRVAPENVVTTFGANHALDLVIRRYLAPGDTVLVDEPGYYPLFAKLELSSVRAIGVLRTATGPDLDDLRGKIRRHRPKILFTQSTAQNPTGTGIDLPSCHAVLQLADKSGMLIVDDDPFIDLSPPDRPRLPLLDQIDNVIAIGTYSKCLSASLRSGYIIADRRRAADLAELKLITTVNSARISEILIADMIRSGRFQKHIGRLSRRLETARDNCLAAFTALGLTTYAPDPQGYYTLLCLPRRRSARALATAALRKSIFLAPNDFFTLGSNAVPEAIRINFCRADDSRFYRFLRDEFGARGRKR